MQGIAKSKRTLRVPPKAVAVTQYGVTREGTEFLADSLGRELRGSASRHPPCLILCKLESAIAISEVTHISLQRNPERKPLALVECVSAGLG